MHSPLILTTGSAILTAFYRVRLLYGGRFCKAFFKKKNIKKANSTTQNINPIRVSVSNSTYDNYNTNIDHIRKIAYHV